VEFSRDLRADVLTGRVTISFRLWRRPKVKAGGRYRVEAGQIEVDSVDLVPFSSIDDADLRLSGERDLESLRRRAAHAGPIHDDTLVYRIEFHVVDEAPGDCCMEPHPMKSPMLRTRRLVLRRWTDSDREPVAAITADAEVMRYRFAQLSRSESDRLIDENEELFDEQGFGLWAVERREDGRLLGYAGFGTSNFDAAFCPAIDAGWTLGREAWGHGYATEAGIAALDYGFGTLGLDEIVAHTTSLNERSRAVMRRLGMTHDSSDDFDAPWYDEGHPHRRFVLYRVRMKDWRAGRESAPRAGAELRR
jgi:RimJ/RimL family protein N-acetyltransferase